MFFASFARDGGACAWRELQGSQTGNCTWVCIVSRVAQKVVWVHTHAIWRGRSTTCTKHQQLYHKMHSGDIRTWRSSDVNIFATENTLGKRMNT
jgi:hypothetical protein